MNKIPTLFTRDDTDRRYVTTEVTPACEWVLAGEGTPTRKYDGTCVMFDGERWWARREVKPGKSTPANFVVVSVDGTTGKTMGWEPIEQSAFAKYHAETVRDGGAMHLLDQYPHTQPQAGATYELVGEKVNGNPEKIAGHLLIRHGYRAAVDDDAMRSLKLDHAGLREWLLTHPGWEGLVFHHPDGRMAKIKRRDFRADRSVPAKPTDAATLRAAADVIDAHHAGNPIAAALRVVAGWAGQEHIPAETQVHIGSALAVARSVLKTEDGN